MISFPNVHHRKTNFIVFMSSIHSKKSIEPISYIKCIIHHFRRIVHRGKYTEWYFLFVAFLFAKFSVNVDNKKNKKKTKTIERKKETLLREHCMLHGAQRIKLFS